MKWTSEGGAAALFGGNEAPLFGRRQKRTRGPRLPVIVVTGFLGAGKTTLLRALLDKPAGANTWAGRFYSPEEGKTVNGDLTLKDANTVTVRGCLLGGLLCRSETWVRVR